MEITSIILPSLRNTGHYQFQTDFSSLVIKYTPQALGIVDDCANYSILLNNEGIAMVEISKSATTAEIEIGDYNRDFTNRGLSDKVKSSLKHFNPQVREATKKVKVIFDGYGNINPKPYDEESTLINSLIADLRTKLPAEIVTLGIVEWIDELECQNNVFIALESSRNTEEANRTELRMKQTRVEVDAAYKQMVKCINALIVVNGDAAYAEFVKELNTRIGRAKRMH